MKVSDTGFSQVRRVVVLGGPGSGKSSLAVCLAECMGVACVELDGLWWRPDWTPAGRDQLRADLGVVLRIEGWVVDGNYVEEVADLVWRSADVIVWLDVPRRVAVRRALRRSVGRLVRATSLWNGNRESLAVLSPRSITRFFRRWPSYSEQIAVALDHLDVPAERVIRLRSDAEVERWLATLRNDRR